MSVICITCGNAAFPSSEIDGTAVSAPTETIRAKKCIHHFREDHKHYDLVDYVILKRYTMIDVRGHSRNNAIICKHTHAW